MVKDTSTPRGKIWDVPTRLGHWLLVLLFFCAWWTADNGEMYWHRYIGYMITGLIVFRIYWGFFGSTTARFQYSLRGPSTIFMYLRSLLQRDKGQVSAGHNPLGALSAMMLLSLVLLQVLLGLFAVDVDGMEAGPLSLYVSFELGREAAIWHERIFNLLLALIGLHISAVIFYWIVCRQDLIGRMIHGQGALPPNVHPLRFAPVWRLIAGLTMAAIVVWYLKSLDVPL